jgi:hypothetical protein
VGHVLAWVLLSLSSSRTISDVPIGFSTWGQPFNPFS